MISRILQFDVDGDQLNVIVDPLFVEIAERNIEKYKVIPLFYDSEKAHAELISKESLFNGLKRAHEYSNIGEISNMLTRVWNSDNPDREVAALLTYLNNLRIDGAKTGIVHEYKNYPDKKKKINAACLGNNSRMPAFFEFTRNGRKDTPENRNRKYAEPNNSTMNRFCKAFNDIKKMTFNHSGIPQFNYQMLMSGICEGTNEELINLFCDMDNANISMAIETKDIIYNNEKILVNDYNFIAEDIKNEIITRYGSLEYAYPFIVKHFFTGENADKAAHKKMFWRVFGDIALSILKNNLENYDVCPECGIKVPSWVEHHVCDKNAKGFYYCVDCNKRCEKTHPRQYRCEDCQEIYNHLRKNARQKNNRRNKKAEKKDQCILRLQSSSNET